MKILQFCFRIPFPLNDGGAIAMYNLTKGLAEYNGKVDIFTFNTQKHYQDITLLPDDFKKIANIYAVNIDTNINILDAFLNFFSDKSYIIKRFIDEEVRFQLTKLLDKNNYDIIQLEGLYVTPYLETIKKHSKAKIVLRAHNVEHKIWERLASNLKPGPKWLYIRNLAKKLKKYEASQLNKCDLVAAMGAEDVRQFKNMGCTAPVVIAPVGIDLDKYKINGYDAEFPSIFHIGALDWMPNQYAVKWFLKNVWKTLHLKYPELKFYISGKNMPKWLTSKKKIKSQNVIILGEIKDAVQFMNSKTIMVVPLFSGSGIRVKILEGMALGKIILSTAIGAEGIECEHNKNIIIANTKEEFIQEIERCIKNKTFCDEIGKNARLLIKQQYSIETVTKNLLVDYHQLI